MTADPLTWLRAFAGAALLLLPGYLLARRFEAPSRCVGAFLGSCVVLFAVTMGLTAAGLPLRLGTVGTGLLIVAMALAWRWPQGAGTVSRGDAVERRAHAWWLLTLPALASVALLAVLDPLCGPDTAFRWNHLARLMLVQESLASYPPVTEADFELYAWCDGIPPLASLLTFWVYCTAGSADAALTAIRILLEGAAVYAATAWLARAVTAPGSSGRTPAAPSGVSAAVLSSSTLILWSIAMGQESALLAASFVALIAAGLDYQARPGAHAALWMGMAAAVGAISREYGLAYVALAAGALLCQRPPLRHLAVAAAPALVTAGPWYLRNWALTGNPLYPQLSGLFPGNPVHTLHAGPVARQWSFSSQEYDASIIPVLLLVLAGVPVVIGLWGLVRAGRRALLPWCGLGLIVALWAISVPQTAAGWVIGLRVLAPAVAMLAAFSGWVATLRGPLRAGVVGVLLLIVGDAAARVWIVPSFALERPLPDWAERWREKKDILANSDQPRFWPGLVRQAAGAGVVVDHPQFHTNVVNRGGRAIPLFSPVMRPAFSPTTSFADMVLELRQRNIRFIVVDYSFSWTREFAATYPFWQELKQQPPAIRLGAGRTLYDLENLR